jgi:hypothetical protein
MILRLCLSFRSNFIHSHLTVFLHMNDKNSSNTNKASSFYTGDYSSFSNLKRETFYIRPQTESLTSSTSTTPIPTSNPKLNSTQNLHLPTRTLPEREHYNREHYSVLRSFLCANNFALFLFVNFSRKFARNF